VPGLVALDAPQHTFQPTTSSPLYVSIFVETGTATLLGLCVEQGSALRTAPGSTP